MFLLVLPTFIPLKIVILPLLFLYYFTFSYCKLHLLSKLSELSFHLFISVISFPSHLSFSLPFYKYLKYFCFSFYFLYFKIKNHWTPYYSLVSRPHLSVCSLSLLSLSTPSYPIFLYAFLLKFYIYIFMCVCLCV